VSEWIEEHGVGWVLTGDNEEEIARDMAAFGKSPERKAAMFERCHRVYTENFQRARATREWSNRLRLLLGERAPAEIPSGGEARTSGLS
jgi:hypothetical protein